MTILLNYLFEYKKILISENERPLIKFIWSNKNWTVQSLIWGRFHKWSLTITVWIISNWDIIWIWKDANPIRNVIRQIFLFIFRVKYIAHPCGLQTLFFVPWVLIFIIGGTCGMEKDENSTFIYFFHPKLTYSHVILHVSVYLCDTYSQSYVSADVATNFFFFLI